MNSQETDKNSTLIASGNAVAIASLIKNEIEPLGYEVVRVSLESGEETTLQIMADRADGSEITVGDCAKISRAVSTILDEKDPVAGTYLLEVSSPGIDRPLTRLKDFSRWTDFKAEIETDHTTYRGILLGVDASSIRLQSLNDEHKIEFASIKRANLVLNDQLLAATKKVA